MKIAVASTNGLDISDHFGRSVCFVVFEAKDGKVVNHEIRQNNQTAFAKGECKNDGKGNHHHETHSHAGVVSLLGDCEVVLCHGMGWRAAEELKANGIQAVVFGGDGSAEEAVGVYLSGELKSAPFCSCHQ